MTLLDRYYIRRLLATVAKILIALVLLTAIIDLLVSRQDNILKYQIPAWVVAAYYVTMTPTILFEFHAAALSVLIAGLMVMGKTAQDNEVTAQLAGGISLWRIARAPILVALLLAVGAFVFQETLGVRASRMCEEISHKYFSKVSDKSRYGVSWTNLEGGWTCHILKFNTRAMTGQDVFLHAIRADKVEEIRAGRIWWDAVGRVWMLEDGRRAQFNPGKDWEVTSERITLAAAPFHEPPEVLFALDAPARTKTVAALSADLRRAGGLGMSATKQWLALHLKFAQPALCFIMIWLAIPFALRLRRGGFALGFGASIAIALAYLSVFYISIGLGYIGKLPPAAAAWSANGLFLLIGLYLFRRTPT